MGVNTAGTRSDTRAALRGARGVNVLESVTINQPIEMLYRFWRNLENLPQFMRHLDSVEKVTDTISHWRAKGPAGTVLEWNAEIFNEIPNKLIAWRSLEGADVVSAGSVNFDVRRRPRHARHRAPAVQPAGRQGRRGAREAVRRRRGHGDPRRSPPLQTAARGGRSADHDGSAQRVASLQARSA